MPRFCAPCSMRSGAPDWVVSVAYEEAAKVEVDRGDLHMAIDLLQDCGRAISARHHTSHSASLRRRPCGSDGQTAPIWPRRCSATERRGGESPRYVYSQAPIGDLERLRHSDSRGETDRLSGRVCPMPSDLHRFLERDRNMRRLASCVLTVLVGLGTPCPFGSEPAVGSGYRGHSLIYALEDLQDKGLRVLYSSDLVDPEMMS